MLEDDIDGGQAVETLAFAFEGESYVIDLNEKTRPNFARPSCRL